MDHTPADFPFPPHGVWAVIDRDGGLTAVARRGLRLPPDLVGGVTDFSGEQLQTFAGEQVTLIPPGI